MDQTLYPTADGTYQGISYPARPHYNESVSMDSGPSYQTDTYTMGNPTRSGHITNVRVSFYGYTIGGNSGDQYGKTAIYKSGSGVLYGSANYLGGGGATYNTDYALNPWTGIAWTWDEIDALEAGFALKAKDESHPYAAGNSSILIITSVSSGGQVRVIGQMM